MTHERFLQNARNTHKQGFKMLDQGVKDFWEVFNARSEEFRKTFTGEIIGQKRGKIKKEKSDKLMVPAFDRVVLPDGLNDNDNDNDNDIREDSHDLFWEGFKICSKLQGQWVKSLFKINEELFNVGATEQLRELEIFPVPEEGGNDNFEEGRILKKGLLEGVDVQEKRWMVNFFEIEGNFDGYGVIRSGRISPEVVKGIKAKGFGYFGIKFSKGNHMIIHDDEVYGRAMIKFIKE